MGSRLGLRKRRGMVRSIWSLIVALGWLAREDKIEIHQEEDELYVSLGVNVYIG